MLINGSLLVAVLLPVLFAPIVFVLGRRFGKRIGWLALVPLICITLFLIYLIPVVQENAVSEQYVWAPVMQLNFGLLADGLSVSVFFMLAFVFTVSILLSIPYMERRIAGQYGSENKTAYAIYYTLFLLYAASVGGAMLATNLVELYIFFEVALISSWGLVVAYAYGDRWKIALKYFLWSHVGAFSLLSGILLVRWRVGSFEIADLWMLKGDPMALWIGVAIMLGLFVKIAALGLHSWLPDTYSESPAPVSAVIGATSVCLGTYFIIRLLAPLQDAMLPISGWIELWALLTILYGGLMALVQTDFKRVVAYLSMSQMNYCVLGAFTYVELGVLGAASYSISHGLAIALLFLVSGSILYRTGTRDINKMGGLVSKMPSAIIASLIGFLTIGGVPPTVGFKSKFVLLTGAFERGFASSYLELSVAAIAATLATVITLAYEFWVVWRVFYGSLPEDLRGVKESPSTIVISLLVLGSLSVVIGIWPALITDPLEVVISGLLG